MNPFLDLRVFELLSARLCHDLVGPIAAINNGVELLTDEDPEFVRDAISLVGDSARKAANRLQFYRFAYGFSQGAMAGPAPHALASGLFDGTAILCDYGEGVRALGLEWQKLACNLLMVGGESLPRGGSLMLSAGALGPALDAVGEGAGPSAAARSALVLEVPVAELTARTISAYFTGLLGQALGCRLVTTSEPGSFRISPAPLTGVG